MCTDHYTRPALSCVLDLEAVVISSTVNISLVLKRLSFIISMKSLSLGSRNSSNQVMIKCTINHFIARNVMEGSNLIPH